MSGSFSVAVTDDSVLEPVVHPELKMVLFGQFLKN